MRETQLKILALALTLLGLVACESFIALSKLANGYHAAAVGSAGLVDDGVEHLLVDACRLAAKQLADAAAEAQKALLNEEPGAKIRAHSAELAREKMLLACKAAGIRPGAPPPPKPVPLPAVVTTDMGPAPVQPPAPVPAAPSPPAVVVPAPPTPPVTPPLPVLGTPLSPSVP